MSSFEERLSRLESGAARPRRAVTMDPSDLPDREERKGPGLAQMILAIPFGVAFGAFAVVAGGVVQVNFVQNGLGAVTEIPPDLGFISLGIALVLSFLFDRIVRAGVIGPISVTLGFLAMIFGEAELAQMYPKAWEIIYMAEYLEPIRDVLEI